eukprot:gene14407-17596_t
MPPPFHVETQRLIIRSWTMDDVDSYLCLAGDEGYCRFGLPGQFSLEVTEARERIQDRMDLYEEKRVCKFLVLLKASGEVVGTCGLGVYPVDGREEMELGYRLRGAFWGQGYATEAAKAILAYGFEGLGVERIVAFTAVQNAASVRVLERLGFRYLKVIEHADAPNYLYEIEACAPLEGK